MKKTREQIIESLRAAELGEGRSGLVDAFLASPYKVDEPVAKAEKKPEKKGRK
uniref:Uncharacterized protein n=1 Tax=viral metagenome TaxID=1070528 RepID=A0A6M3J6C4_9ZZZZ